MLLFAIKDDRYAMPTERIVEIIPLVRFKKIPKTADHVAGMINYHGEPVPVIDLGVLIGGSPCDRYYSTRIILVNYPLAQGEKLLGIMAERATSMISNQEGQIDSGRILIDEALHTSEAGGKNDGIVQWFDLVRMVPEGMVAELLRG
ncbi:chemotaxis protein CheW [Desulfurivibrio sp. D14AmB]|uniref:chemotaxis protein CheW n=1 Tax=Desulfurivibrio sp. D14AmB TaxID=3374370 RepID=UPI00376EB1F4